MCCCGCNVLNVRLLCIIAKNRVFAPNSFLVQKKRVVFNIDCWAFSTRYDFMRLFLALVGCVWLFACSYEAETKSPVAPWVRGGTMTGENFTSEMPIVQQEEGGQMNRAEWGYLSWYGNMARVPLEKRWKCS